jgi:hypothetical protein
MGEAQLGGTGSGVTDSGSGGGLSTGPGGAPATGSPSPPPAGVTFSPETVRAILSGIWMPAGQGAAEVPLSPVSPVEGVVELPSVERLLPDLLARATATRTPLTMVLARPGGAAADAAAPGAVADLAASLSVSLSPDQHLLQAGPGHLAVVLPGGPGAGRRNTERLMQRAALAGAPMLTWAMASYPRDGASSAALIAAATGRLQLPADERRSAGVTARRGRDALWAGVAAAMLAGVFAYTFGSGHGSSPAARAERAARSGQAGLAAAGGSAPGAGGSAGASVGSVQTSGPSSWLGSSAAGTSGSSADTSGTGSATGTGSQGSSGSPAGQGGSSQGSAPGLPVGGTNQEKGTGATPTTTLPLNVTTTIPVTTTTTTAPAGGTPTAGTAGTPNTHCTGLLQGLICTVNGLLGGH